MTDGPSIAPYVSCVDAKAAMAFLVRALGREPVQNSDNPDSRLLHGEIHGGGGVIMLGAEGDEWSFGNYLPQTAAPAWSGAS